jgi:periplasmic copper chaperone A
MTNHSRGVSLPLFIFTTLGLAAFAPSAFAHDPQQVADATTIGQAQMDHGGMSMPMSPAPASGDSYKIGDLTVATPWARATPGGAKIGGGYLTVTNNGSSADRLVGATVEFADHVEIHEMSMTDGVMKMREISSGLEIKPGATVELKPGGFHMMFVDLKQPLKQGDSVKVTLKFEKAGSLDVKFSVGGIGATSGGGMQHQH